MYDDLLRPTVGAGVDVSARPWRLLSQTYVAFFGGVIAVTVIAYLNAGKLGVAPDRRRLILVTGAGGLVVATTVVVLLASSNPDISSSGMRVADRMVAVLVCLIQLRIQRPMDRAFQVRGGDYGSLWKPGLAAVFGCGLAEAGLLLVVVGLL